MRGSLSRVMAFSVVAVNMSDVLEDAQMKQHFAPVRVLGSGGFGTVLHAVNLVTGQDCAVKVLRKSQMAPSRLNSLRKEAEILASLQHPNIVAFRGLRETQSNLYLELEIVTGGTLSDLMSHPLSDLQAAQAMKGLFRAVQYLHAHGVLHRDLKPQNILVGDANDLTSVKVADFGLSQQLGRLDASDVYCGTMPYMAPEQIARRYYGKSVDVWSCGIIMAMLCCGGRHPLKEKSDSPEDYLAKLREPQWNIAALSPLAQSLFLRLVRLQPVERYSPAQALKHPWILRDGSEVPLTSFEQFRVYNDEVRTRKVLWAIFLLGKLARTHSNSQLQTEASADSPVLPVPPVAVRCYSVRIRRTPSAKHRTQPPKPRPASRRILRESPPKRASSRLGMLKPVPTTRRSNVSFSVS